MDSRHTWTQKELAVLRKHYASHTWQEMCRLIPNHTRDAIRIKAKEFGIRQQIDPLKRFMSFVVKHKNGCWNWTGSKCRGYGQFKYKGKSVRAHRWIFEHTYGHIDIDLTIDHMCKNPSCVNPDHLRELDAVTNVMIGNAIPAINASTETMNTKNNQPGIRRFHFVRSEDVSGVSGTGVVGEGCELSNGKVCFTWISNKGTVSVYDNMKVFLSIHGHEGRGAVEWLDPDPTDQVEPEPEAPSKKRTTKKS